MSVPQMIKNNDLYLNYENHPLLTDTAILQTNELEKFVNVIRQWLDNLLPGGIVYGLQRTGKTQAIQYFLENGSSLLNMNIPMTLVSASDSTNSSTSENRFFGELLRVMGYGASETGTAAIKRRRVIDFMIQRSRDSSEHRYLLFVDEAQWLSTSQYRYLMDLHNQLKIEGIRLVVILVGQPELKEKKTDLRGECNQGHLLGRFMTVEHEFKGVVHFKDWKKMLEVMDQHTEYPIGSGCTYTNFFLPELYQKGWRLEEQAQKIWDILNEECRRRKIPKIKHYPMQPLMALLRWLLVELSKQNVPKLSIDNNLINEAILRVAITQIEDNAYSQ